MIALGTHALKLNTLMTSVPSDLSLLHSLCSEVYFDKIEMCHISLLCQLYSNEYGDNSHDLFQDRRDDEPQITEEVFFSEMLPAVRVNVQVLVPELKKHGILLDESIMSSLDTHMDRIDELYYVMYKLGKKENGLQIFYRCLRETQDEFPDHRRVADRLEVIGKNNFIANINSTLITCFNLFIICGMCSKLSLAFTQNRRTGSSITMVVTLTTYVCFITV